jgi:hypothetical protein
MHVGDADYDSFGLGPRRPPRIRFSAIGDAWELLLQQWGVWMLTALIVLVCHSVVSGFVYALFRVPNPGGVHGFRPDLTPQGQAVSAALSMIINGFFLGGMFRMACLQCRGQRISVETLFSITDVLPNLILGALLEGLICAVAFFCCVLPVFVASGVLMFTFPLIVDARLEPMEAVRQSWFALKDQWFSATLFHLVVSILASAGTCLCCVGILVTAPLYSLSVAVLYRDFFLAPETKAGGKPIPPVVEF